MDVSHLLNQLNPVQCEAVSAPPEHILVLAGAGTGKTRVLVHRIAWLLESELARPYHILAVTFTNKAAQEMQHRITTLIKTTPQGLWAGTFHGIAHRLLRIHWREANLPQAFQILDEDDQHRTVKRVIKALGIDEKAWSPRQAQHFINKQKDSGLRAKELTVEGHTSTTLSTSDKWLQQMITIYSMYEKLCEQSGSVDFAELLLRTYEMLRDNPTLLVQYHQRFRFILVDEFQDTNTLQYLWLKLLTGTATKLFVVGDDDQSIYGWRGARIENIQHFNRDFPSTRLIRLEQNYRSTGIILAAANALIAYNRERLGKNLWTEDKTNHPVYLYSAYSEIDEAEFVIERIKNWQGQWREIAILYRTSAQSRLFEEQLLDKRIPYRIYGGLRFYERAEVKDALAYLRLICYRDNDDAFERVINTPKRGIGDRTVESLRSIARSQGISLWKAAQQALASEELKARAATNLRTFLQLIETLAERTQPLPLDEKIKMLIAISGLVEHYKKEAKEEAQRRLENLDELVVAAHQFKDSGKDGIDPVTAFLAHAVLESGEGQAHRGEDCVQLMTLHLAKGLEFTTVFLCGLEEGLFPHQNSISEGKLEEERRLCYVGVTRARRYLYLCYSETRYRYGSRDSNLSSRFIHEIPSELVEEVRLRAPTSRFKFST